MFAKSKPKKKKLNTYELFCNKEKRTSSLNNQYNYKSICVFESCISPTSFTGNCKTSKSRVVKKSKWTITSMMEYIYFRSMPLLTGIRLEVLGSTPATPYRNVHF